MRWILMYSVLDAAFLLNASQHSSLLTKDSGAVWLLFVVSYNYTVRHHFSPGNNFDTFLFEIGLQTGMCE